jgi:toxin ParE1/3/4
MKPFVLHECAEAELREALKYYEEQRTGLGGEFRREFEAALERVRENPLAYAIEDNDGVRYAPFRRFPYKLVYVDLSDHIWIAAVAHHRRRPRYWSGRHPE